jgi:hypothetical protein
MVRRSVTDANWLFLSGCLAVIGITCLAAAMVASRRRPVAAVAAPASPMRVEPWGGPIARLDFRQSLDPEMFAHAAEQEALSYARLHLRDLLADGTVITLQSLRQWAAGTEMVVGASAEATAALRSGAAVLQQHGASTRLLPHVADSKTGQMMEVMKEVGAGRKLVAGAAAASTIIVSAAHMIATADLARTLRLMDQKLDLLLVYRRIDQNAALESIYAAAKELLAAPLGEAQQMEMWRLRGELRELRAGWRRELEHHLLQIENPAEEGWFDRMFTSQHSYDQRISGKISGGMLQLAMVEYSLRLDRVLAVASDTWDVSVVTLTDELGAIERLGALLKEKADFISDTKRGSARPMIEGLEAMVAQYRALIEPRPELVLGNTQPAVPLLEGGTTA